MKVNKKPTRWLALGAIKKTGNLLKQDCRSYPAAVWYTWGRCLAIGIALSMLFTFAVTSKARSLVNDGLQTWDEQTLQKIAQLPFTFAHGITWESPGNLLGMLFVVISLTLVNIWCRRSLIAVTLFAGYVLQFAIAWTGWLSWNRDRPDLIAGGVGAPDLHSFPSGHALAVTTVYGFVFYLWFRASKSTIERIIAVILFLLWVTAVSSSRLLLGAHWVSDIIAGFVFALPWLFTLIVALNKAESVISKLRRGENKR